MKFLVVDDEKDVEMLFRQKFRTEIKEGLLEMVFAFSGKEALEIINSTQPPDVLYIFSDINMPGISGLELLKIVQDQHPSIKVSIISAYGDRENYQKAMEAGAEEFFTKPIDFDSIKKEIYQLLESRED